MLPSPRLQEEGLDALIITGANVSNPTLEPGAVLATRCRK